MDEKELRKIDTDIVEINEASRFIELALEKGAEISVLERLFEMYKEVEARRAEKAFNNALSILQGKLPPIKKTKTVEYKNKAGYVTKYYYASLDHILEQVKKLLKNHGFAYTFKTDQEEKFIITTCYLKHIEGHVEKETVKIPIDFQAYMNIAQKVGSSKTYGMRYAFCGVCGIMTADQDDDGGFPDSDQKDINKKVKEDSQEKEKLGGMYSYIMSLLQEKFINNEHILSLSERKEKKKAADKLRSNLSALKIFAQDLNKLFNERRKQNKSV